MFKEDKSMQYENSITDCINHNDLTSFEIFVEKFNEENNKYLNASYLWAGIQMLNIDSEILLEFMYNSNDLSEEFYFDGVYYSVFTSDDYKEYLEDTKENLKFDLERELKNYPTLIHYIDIDAYFEDELSDSYVYDSCTFEDGKLFYLIR